MLALACVAAGSFPLLAAFDIGPLDSSAINGPLWLGALAGGILVMAGISLRLLGENLRSGLLSYSLFAILLGAFAAIGNGIAFGPWPRQCEIAVVGLPFAVATVQARLFELLPSPPLTTSQVDLLRTDNVVSGGLPGFRELGIAPKGVEEVVPTYIGRSHVPEPH